MFKVGDFVRWNNKKVFRVTSIDTSLDESEELQLFDGTWDCRNDEPNGYYADECELWQPKVGEWCWVFNKFARYEGLDEVFSNTGYTHTFWIPPLESEFATVIGDNLLSVCEPFTGSLPTFVKEK